MCIFTLQGRVKLTPVKYRTYLCIFGWIQIDYFRLLVTVGLMAIRLMTIRLVTVGHGRSKITSSNRWIKLDRRIGNLGLLGRGLKVRVQVRNDRAGRSTTNQTSSVKGRTRSVEVDLVRRVSRPVLKWPLQDVRNRIGDRRRCHCYGF